MDDIIATGHDHDDLLLDCLQVDLIPAPEDATRGRVPVGPGLEVAVCLVQDSVALNSACIRYEEDMSISIFLL